MVASHQDMMKKLRLTNVRNFYERVNPFAEAVQAEVVQAEVVLMEIRSSGSQGPLWGQFDEYMKGK
jgi:hypothetical protein